MTGGNGRTLVDFDRLEKDLKHTPLPPMPVPGQEVARFGPSQNTAIQVIGHAITRLTWREAEKMGSAIQVKMKDGMSLTSAIQAWAEDWEKFD